MDLKRKRPSGASANTASVEPPVTPPTEKFAIRQAKLNDTETALRTYRRLAEKGNPVDVERFHAVEPRFQARIEKLRGKLGMKDEEEADLDELYYQRQKARNWARVEDNYEPVLELNERIEAIERRTNPEKFADPYDEGLDTIGEDDSIYEFVHHWWPKNKIKRRRGGSPAF